MKKSIIACLTIMTVCQTYVFGQTEKEVKSKITNVAVYTSGAQVERDASIELQPGKSILTFKNLSPYIRKESIRVDGDGNYTILNVQLQNDYLNKLEKSKEVNDLRSGIEQFSNKIEDEETWIKILNEKLEFLKSNKSISGKDQSVNPEVFKSLYQIYGDNYEKYSLEILKRKRLISVYTKEAEKLENQLNTLTSQNELPSGIITVLVDSKKIQSSTIQLSYLVDNARWYPSYDIRFTSINKPLTILFKANISQNTGVDWKNISLKLSTAKTNVSAQIPTLNTNYLQFYIPREISALQGRLSGTMLSNNTPEKSDRSKIVIRGNSSFNDANPPLYVVDGIIQENIAYLNPDDINNMNVLKAESATAIYGSQGANGVIEITTKSGQGNAELPLTITDKNITSNEYTVDAEQSIASDNKLNSITFRELALPATFEYQSIPKLSKNVYLIGKINDWNKADLLDGEANIYLENSYVGKSRINTQQFSDTLDISFGVDNNVTVNREKIKDFSQSEFFGSNKKETYAWKLTMRNNKPYAIKAKLYDQVPVSSNKEIEVETLELSDGNMNTNTGKVVWNIELQPNETKQVVLKYSVRSPKDKIVLVD